jgi:hypothetical protein
MDAYLISPEVSVCSAREMGTWRRYDWRFDGIDNREDKKIHGLENGLLKPFIVASAHDSVIGSVRYAVSSVSRFECSKGGRYNNIESLVVSG